ncbi:MAG TPA: hypothetical protein PKE29_01405 [Phycisphaerales bacterium]|nr:hypothetical protein [Phycisphaerales bacterium]
MKNLASRLAALERLNRLQHPPESVGDARRAWPGRFARHSPANTTLMDRIRQWMRVHCPTSLRPQEPWPDAWCMIADLTLHAGYDVRAGGEVFRPSSPTASEQVAIAFLEELLEAINRYETETGDLYPVIKWPKANASSYPT